MPKKKRKEKKRKLNLFLIIFLGSAHVLWFFRPPALEPGHFSYFLMKIYAYMWVIVCVCVSGWKCVVFSKTNLNLQIAFEGAARAKAKA